MAHVSGPCSTLPGNCSHEVPVGTMCDDHPDRPAVRRVQGETDSFGAEYSDMCQECYDDYKNNRQDYIGTCDWCDATDTKLIPHRDYEEGMSGRVYYVCSECIHREYERLKEELDDDYYD